MKKIFLSLMVFMMAFAAVISFTSCGPTAGLEEIDYEDIAKAKLYDNYIVTTKTITYNSDGSKKSTETTDSVSLSGTAVKATIAASKVSVDFLKAVSPKSSGKVCANSDYSKIVTYVYTRDNDGKLSSEYIATYKKQ